MHLIISLIDYAFKSSKTLEKVFSTDTSWIHVSQDNNMILCGGKTLSVRPSTTGNTDFVRTDIFGGIPGSSLGSSTLYVSL